MLRWAGGISRREVLARLTVASWALVPGCRQEVRPATLRGLVIDVQVASFSQIASFTLRTDDGSDHEFIVEGDVGITPGHMREHMLLGEAVIVSIRYADGLQIATHIADAPPAP